MSKRRISEHVYTFEPKTPSRNVFQSTSTKTTYSYLQKMCDLNFMMILIQIRLQQENCNIWFQTPTSIEHPKGFLLEISIAFVPPLALQKMMPYSKHHPLFFSTYNPSKKNTLTNSVSVFVCLWFLSNKENYNGCTPCISKWNNFCRFKKNKTANASGHWLNLLDLVTRCPFRPTVSGPVVLWDTKLCWVGRGWQGWRGVCLEAGDFPFRFWPDLMPQKLEVTYTVDPFLKRGRGTQHPTGRSPHKGHQNCQEGVCFVSLGYFFYNCTAKILKKVWLED